AEAWREFQTAPFDVVITDWMMPGLAGPELCRRVRQRADDGYTYVILATALGRHENVLEGMEAGADDYLTKPAVPFDLGARRVARALGRSTRAADRAYRYGGEEFVVLFANQTLEQGVHGMERLRQAVEDLGIAHAGRSVPGVVTISVGVSALDPAGDDTPSALLEAADEALYRAKRDGRNRVVPGTTASYTTSCSPTS